MKNQSVSFYFLLSFLSIALFLSACESTPTKVACVGDSITNGTNIMGGNIDQYPNILDSLMGNNWTVKNFGHSGSTMLKDGDLPYWKVPEYNAAIEFQPDIVVIKLGTNDTKPWNWDKHKNSFKQNYIDLVQTFQALPSKPTIYICIPAPIGDNPFQIRSTVAVQEITPIIHEVAETCKVKIIDFNALLKDRMDLIPDKVHPNVTGKVLMAKEVMRVLKK